MKENKSKRNYLLVDSRIIAHRLIKPRAKSCLHNFCNFALNKLGAFLLKILNNKFTNFKINLKMSIKCNSLKINVFKPIINRSKVNLI
jgi:hypothetical protein